MGYFIVLILSWCDSFLSKKRGILLTVVAFTWMAYLGGSASPITTTDYASYQYYYDLVASGLPGNRLEWLYTFLSKVAISFNLDYPTFRMWLISATFIILIIAVIRLTERPIVFAALFLIFPFFNEITQVRSFVAYSIVLLGVSFLKQCHFHNLIIFGMAIVLAMGFHSSAAIFFLLPIVRALVKRIGIIKVAIGANFLVLLFTILLVITAKVSVVVNLISRILEVVAGNSVSVTFTTLISHSNGSKTFLLMAVILYIANQWYLTININNLALTDSQFQIPYASFSLLIMGEVLLPLLLLSDQLQRFQRIGIESGFLIAGTLLAYRLKSKSINFSILMVLFLTLSNMFLYYGLNSINDEFPQSIPYLGHFISQ